MAWNSYNVRQIVYGKERASLPRLSFLFLHAARKKCDLAYISSNCRDVLLLRLW